MLADEATLSRETVLGAFRMILGREPETADVVAFHQRYPSAEALRRALLQSREFATGYARMAAEELAQRQPSAAEIAADQGKHADERPGTVPRLLARGILPPMGPVETAAEGAAGAALFSRVGQSWAAMGAEAPHWSVLTHELFRPDAIEANRPAFEETGEVEGILVDCALERVGGRDPSDMRAVEIGCGVGRATRALAARFAHVTGLDISEAHLAVAAHDLAAAGVANVTLKPVASVADYENLGDFDLVFSRLVLQHNPPPVQAAILARAFAGLAPGGVALVQIVTYGRHYRYAVAEDLGTGPGAMEMHVLPQSEMFALMAEAGIAPLEVQEDFAAGRDGPYRSHLFLGVKAGAAG